jgi:hypothetical protein
MASQVLLASLQRRVPDDGLVSGLDDAGADEQSA